MPGEQNAFESDAVMSLSEMSMPLYQEVSCLAPFGVGNPKPVFLISETIVSSVKRFGKESNHIEVMISCERSGKVARAFDFFKSPDSFTHAPVVGEKADILATLEKDSYRGGLALRLIDIIPSK